MFDPATETEPDWDTNLRDDVKEECSKFGTVEHCAVDKNSKGFVYLKFGKLTSAINAVNSLDQRYFGGRKITAEFLPDDVYKKRFPELIK